MEGQTVKIPQHKHCRRCGNAFVGEGYYCSSECKELDGAEAKKKLRKYGLIVVVLWVITIAAVILIGV